jgi:predicted PurR-regulated permease PerM
MVRKTREQVWRELDDLGEEEVRERLALQPGDVGEAGLVREWLDQKARAAAELASTREASDRAAVSSSGPEAVAARSGLDPRTVGIMGILLLGMLYTLYFARAFLLPITIATLLNFLLSPAVRALKRLRLPEPVGAALVVLGLLGLSGVGAYQIAGPAQEWLAKGPASLSQAWSRLERLRRPVERVTHTAEQVEQAASGGGERPAEVVVRGPTFGARLFGATQSVLTASVGIVILLYFLLATGDLFLLKLVRVLPQFGDKRKAVSIMKETETSISRYLVTVAMVNLGQGVVVGLVMYLIGMPNAALWGALAGAAEFIPYVGALCLVVILALTGLVVFDHVGHALLVPGAYLVVTLLQSNVVTPMVLGHRLALNPVAIFIGLAFWLWIWGLPGAFIAVPVLATLKICCDHIEMLAPVGEFLGE